MSQLKQPDFKDYISLFVLSAVWGTAFIGIEIAIENIDIIHVTFGRVLFASLFLLPILFYKKFIPPKDMGVWVLVVISALLNTAIPFSLINYGQQYITSGMSALMIGFGPFITLVLAHFMTQDEKFSFTKLFAFFFGFIGLMILLGVNILEFNIMEVEGQLAVLLASLSYSLSSIVLRKIKGISFYHLSFIMFVISTFALLPFVFSREVRIESAFDTSFLALIYLGIFPTAIASLYRIQMVQSVGVHFMSQVAYLIPLFALLWAWLVLNEIPKSSTFIALIFILLGMYLGKKK
jgi:drug/metabolite transporter (DMT)-like permease